jgi:hypothetical protein
MKIHVIKTPEYEFEEYLKVCEFLQSFQGPMEFISTEYEFDKNEFYFLRYELYPEHSFKYPSNDSALPFDSSRGAPLSWREMFSLCENYREKEEIQSNDFVILLTKRKNGMNWFSAFDQKNNAFVHTAEWELYTKDVSPKYPIAYEVVANTLQTLMNVDLNTIPNEYIHQPFKACMNDLCQNKKEIIIKLSNARICPECLDRIKSQHVSNEMLKQAQAIFKGIQSEFDFKVDTKPIAPSKISISEKADIFLDDYNIVLNMPELWKTLYIFFLQHPEGVLLVNLVDFSDNLKSIYRVCRPNATENFVNSKIDNLVYAQGGAFNQVRGRLNNKIIELLKEPRYKNYIIDGRRSMPYSINIPRELVDIDIRF